MATQRTKNAVLGQADPNEAPPEWAIDGEQTDNLPAAIVAEVLDGETVKGGPALQNLMEWLGGHLAEGDDDNMSAIESIVREALSADSVEAVLRERLPASGKDFRDRPLLLHGFRISESDFGEGEGAPAYASMSVTVLANGEPKVLNCGGWAILAQLKRLEELGEWPVRVMIKGKANKKGRIPLRLVLDEA